jgi:hypothetical protein
MIVTTRITSATGTPTSIATPRPSACHGLPRIAAAASRLKRGMPSTSTAPSSTMPSEIVMPPRIAPPRAMRRQARSLVTWRTPPEICAPGSTTRSPSLR